MENDKIIIFTEDIKKDPKNIKEILKKHFNLEEADLHYSRYDKMQDIADIIIEKPECSIFIKHIEKSVFTFINEFIEDENNEGISLSSYYFNSLNFEFSQEFLCIDLDINDDVSGYEDKYAFLCKANKIISNIDNTHLLIASPMTESIVDANNVYTGDSSHYKQYINNTYSKEVNKIISHYKKIVEMNNQKFNGIEPDKYNFHVLNEYSNIKPNIPVYHQIGKLVAEIEL